jgi:septal ring factor EnvC (AmiA/AmiB activator)
MLEKKQNIRNLQVQLDEWQKEIEKLKGQLKDAASDAKDKINKQIIEIEKRIEDGKAALKKPDNTNK